MTNVELVKKLRALKPGTHFIAVTELDRQNAIKASKFIEADSKTVITRRRSRGGFIIAAIPNV